MATVKILSKGQVVIPAQIRKRYNMKTGSKLQLMEYRGIIYLIPPVDNPIEAACGILPAKPSLSAKLLEERKKDFK
ncbi:MAG: AbrB/MazE/SpoVT family DNA-binding domain-containing protein [Candidatus Schekmanbacteria bacterium]|nr:AbrB/MazE/SpoVT family DNA-binding domain-containing protein [Candidatus Schekmanbacteria bacterium]